MPELTHYEQVVEKIIQPYRVKHRRNFVLSEKSGTSTDEFVKQTVEGFLKLPLPEMSYSMTAFLQEMVFLSLQAAGRHCYQDVLNRSIVPMVADSYGRIMMMMMGAKPEQVSAELSLTTVMQYHVASYEMAGKRTYEVTPGLGEQLRDTELRGVMASDLRLPYEAIYIVVPPRAELRVFNPMSGWHRCIGLYVTEDPRMNDMAIPEKWKSAPLRGWRVMAVGEDKQQLLEKGDDAIIYFRIPLPDGESLTAVVNWAGEDFDSHGDTKYAEVTGLGEMADEWRRIFNWAMNVVLYVTYVEAGEHWMMNEEARKLWERIQKLPKNSGKREKLRSRFSGMNPRYRWVLGSKIFVRRGGEQGEHGKSGTTRNVLHVKTRVAGHWKRVVHGKGRELRRWQWIEPYWKFKDGIELSGKTHEVV